MNIETIETLLGDFVSDSTEIQGAVMVSPQGQPLTHPIGLSETSTHIMAGSMLQLASCVSAQCQWQAVNWVTIQALEGYLILAQCIQEVFLLIRAKEVPSGYLQRYIQQYLEKLSVSLRTPEHGATVVQLSYRPTELIDRSVASSTTLDYEKNGGNGVAKGNLVTGTAMSSVPLNLDEFEIAYCQKELAESIGPMASLICDRVLSHNPHLNLIDFVKTLAQHIPDQQMAFDFQRRILSQQSTH